MGNNPILAVLAPVAGLVAGVLVLLAPLLALAGAVLTTWSDPSRTDPPRINRTRAGIRWAAGAAAMFVALNELHRYLPLAGYSVWSRKC